MKVDICRTGINMPEKGLDVFDVGSAFKQMAGKTVAACMGRNRAGNTGKPGAFLKELVDAVRIKVSAGPGAWEKDTLRTAAFVPIFCKKVEIFLGQDGIPVNPSFRFADMDCHVGTGNIIVMEMDGL